MLTVYNKCDKVPNLRFFGESGNDVRISALKGIGLEKLLETMCSMLGNTRRKVKMLLPYAEGAVVSKIRKEGAVMNEEYRDDGIFVEAVLDGSFLNNVKTYLLPEDDKKE